MFNNWLRWKRGRQQSGYDKMLLATGRFPIGFDCYLLRFPEGCEVPPHTDAVSGKRHYRLNIILKNARKGGLFICARPLFQNSRIKFFRPDQCEHSVTRVESGSRYLLSIGWTRP